MAIVLWRAIIRAAEGRNNDQAATAWFSVGYLIETKRRCRRQNIRPTMKAIGQASLRLIADFDEAIRLKPDYAEAYNNRGIAKNNLQQNEDAIVDYDKALRFKPYLAEVYNNRGLAKKELGLKDEARKDFETALVLARTANDAELVDEAEESLRDLDPDGGS